MKEIPFQGEVIKDQRTEIQSRKIGDLEAQLSNPYHILVADIQQQDGLFKTTPIRVIFNWDTDEEIANNVELMTRFGHDDGKEMKNFRLGTISYERAKKWRLIQGYTVVDVGNLGNNFI